METNPKVKGYFEKIAELELQSKFWVNSGGCGVFALLMADLLKEDKLDIVFCQPESRITPLAPAHVMLDDGTYLYDCHGAHEKDSVEMRYGILMKVQREFLKKSLNANNWNSMFDRKTAPKIKKMVEKVINSN